MRLPIHPFPARMAPELALQMLSGLGENSLVLDPMAGSGTVLREAAELGHRALGFDMDPLAVLMARVWTTPVSDGTIAQLGSEVINYANRLKTADLTVPWIDHDEETAEFVRYWFALRQREDLRRLALALKRLDPDADNQNAADVLRIALSRIIITKDRGASLGRDVSHSRPHKVCEVSDFEVIPAFERSLKVVRQRLNDVPVVAKSTVGIGDARTLSGLADRTIDTVVTSPPYLNALDYIRGHRLSLVWLGYSLQQLRSVRSNSVGAERALEPGRSPPSREIVATFGNIDQLPKRHQGIINRYANDIFAIIKEIARVLKSEGKATFVMGNSCLKNVFIQNSDAVIKIAGLCDLKLLDRFERPLPLRHRYLPTPEQGTLGKRMRTETILTFARA